MPVGLLSGGAPPVRVRRWNPLLVSLIAHIGAVAALLSVSVPERAFREERPASVTPLFYFPVTITPPKPKRVEITRTRTPTPPSIQPLPQPSRKIFRAPVVEKSKPVEATV